MYEASGVSTNNTRTLVPKSFVEKMKLPTMSCSFKTMSRMI